MKPKPLKGKRCAQQMGEPSQMYSFYFEYNVKAAVEWLKMHIEPACDNKKYQEWLKMPEPKSKFRLWVIEEAFHDVTQDTDAHQP